MVICPRSSKEFIEHLAECYLVHYDLGGIRIGIEAFLEGICMTFGKVFLLMFFINIIEMPSSIVLIRYAAIIFSLIHLRYSILPIPASQFYYPVNITFSYTGSSFLFLPGPFFSFKFFFTFLGFFRFVLSFLYFGFNFFFRSFFA